jgi:hypothetical protein
VGGAGDAAMESVEGDGVRAAREPDVFGYLGDGADAGEVVLVPGHEQHPILLGHVDGERKRHAREDDGVVKGD